MTTPFEPDIASGFFDEMKSALPQIRDHVQSYVGSSLNVEAIFEAYRLTHGIRNAASMLNYGVVRDIAEQLESVFEKLGETMRPLDTDGKEIISLALEEMEQVLGEPPGAVNESITLDGVRHYREVTFAIPPSMVGDLSLLPPELEPIPDTLPPLEGDVPLPQLEYPSETPSEEIAPPSSEVDLPMPSFIAEATRTLSGSMGSSVADPILPLNFSEVVPMPELEAEPMPVVPPPEPVRDLPKIAPELLEVFLLEAEDHLRNISELLPVLQEQPDNRDALNQIRRSTHTLKGSAAMVGFKKLTQLAHRMEDLLDQLYDGLRPVTTECIQLLFTTSDLLEDLSRGGGDPEQVNAVYERYAVMLAEVAATEKQDTPVQDDMLIPAAAMEAGEAVEADESDPADALAAVQTGQYLRVPLPKLEELAKLVSELVITRSEFEERMAIFTRHLEELKLSATRVRRSSTKLDTEYEARTLGGKLFGPGSGTGSGIGRPIPNPATFQTHGFDALEFDRYTDFHLIIRDLAETSTDLQTVGGELSNLYGDFDGYLNRQTRLTSEIQDKLMRVRMVPLASLSAKLSRTVRQVAEQEQKEVRLLLEGQNTELDKTVLEEMAEPFLHLLRNAVDHGIEPPLERQAADKPMQGTIRIRAFPQGTQIVIQIIDDGRGIEVPAIRHAAVSKGLLTQAEVDSLNDADVIQLIFRPGFSAAKEITEVSGRGVGLDIVNAQVHRLKGTLSVDSRAGTGTTFTIRLPLTLAVMKALMVKVNDQIYAIPLGSVRQLHRLDPKDIGTLGDEEIVRIGSRIFPKVPLARALRLKQTSTPPQNAPAVVLDVGDRTIALIVDQLLGGREIVVKNLGTHLRRVEGIMGATLLGDGSVALILNPGELMRHRDIRSKAVSIEPRLAGVPRLRNDSEDLRIMVVDDSPSVRRIVATAFKNLGWETIPAKDGMEALEILHRSEQLPDAIMLDVEMPRMDGYEFLSTIRAHPNYRGLPTVMVTSRAGEKHRRKAMELGASAYLVKPYQEDDLMQTLRDLVAKSRRTARV